MNGGAGSKTRDDHTGADPGRYCREIESYLCRQNGGHLVRIVGPSFDLVSGWAREGVPLKLVFRGIDRFVERQRARGVARRPARIEFCEGDVRAVFDEWRRALGPLGWSATHDAAVEPAPGDDVPRSKGVGSGSGGVESLVSAGGESLDEGLGDGRDSAEPRRRASLPGHLERVHVRLSSLLASQRLPPELLRVVEDLANAVDGMRGRARARGEARAAMVAELTRRDAELADAAWRTADAETTARVRDEAAADLAGFRSRLSQDRWDAVVEQAARRLLRQELALPDIALE